MASQQYIGVNESRKPLNTAEVSFDMAEEVRQRWVSIANYYVSQRESFLKLAKPDDGLDVDWDFNPFN